MGLLAARREEAGAHVVLKTMPGIRELAMKILMDQLEDTPKSKSSA